MQSRAAFSLLGSVLILIAWASTSAARPCEGGWSTSFSSGDIDGNVNSMLVDGSTLYVAGAFKGAGGVRATGFARWDGQQWHAMDPDATEYGEHVFRFKGELYGSGKFINRLPNESDFAFARWDGAHWQRVSQFDVLEGARTSVVADGMLYLCGRERYWPRDDRIVVWDGESASTSVLYDGRIQDIVVFEGELYAIASGQTNNPNYPSGVIRWNGVAWISTGFPEQDGCDLEVHEGKLYAINNKYENTALYVLQTGVWHRVPGTTIRRGHFGRLLSTPDGLVVGGGFLDIDGQPANSIARWSNGQWSALGDGLDSYVGSIVLYNDALIAAGELYRSGSHRVNNIARFDGSTWLPFSTTASGVYGGGYDLKRSSVAYQGQLVMSDYYSGFANGVVSSCGAWDGHQWNALDNTERVIVDDLISWRNRLYARLFLPNGWGSYVTTNTYYRWTGSSWTSALSGLRGYEHSHVAIGETLYITGNLVAGGVWATFAMYRDGSATSLSGPDLARPYNDYGKLTEFGGYPVIYGYFWTVGGVPARNIASWQEDHWVAFGDGLRNFVSAAASYGGNLYAASNDELWMWDGKQWYLQARLTGSILTLTVYDGALYIGMQNDDPTNSVAYPTLWKLTPKSLLPILDGPTDPVEDLIVVDHGNGPVLTLTGAFALIGDISSPAVAQYTTCPCAADANYDDVVNAADLAVLLSKFNGRVDNSYEGPDFNGDQVVNFADLSVLLSRFGQPCP